ncbi:hypothetical protein M0638_27015 [Roseomonas sp. NAR14]|uniref:Uncharacterized protein n=1 Tax=Roseomonas acroporae TaxID=2937791 RepID=A0A9X1YG10_9PROT|nr:hypothetical protein [Roseomonas acroporae]MCK8788012.1 hypothetical protein [Roseomonas acroporae]
MPIQQFRVLVPSYIGERLVEPGAVVEVDTDVMAPGANLEPVRGATTIPEAGQPARVIAAPRTPNDPLPIVPMPTPDAARVGAQADAVEAGEAPASSLEAAKETAAQEQDAQESAARAKGQKKGG